jgi:hypothetical protein
MTRALPFLLLLLALPADAAPKPAKAPPRKPRLVAAKLVKTTLCGARKPCAVIETLPAGKGAQGEDLVVYKLQLAKDAELGCEAFEYWLLSSKSGKPIASQALLQLCNDGYGASGVGEDSVEVKDNHFSHSQNGGSSWRWGYTKTYQLSPLRVKSEDDDSEWVNGQTASTSTWSWDEFRGETSWFVPACGPDGELVDVDDSATTTPYVYAALPQVSAPPELGKDLWKDTTLGACSLLVDGSAGHGYTIHGKSDAEPATDSNFRAVLVDHDTLLVEVFDDTIVGPSAKWLFDDHLELWLSKAGTPESEQAQCLSPADKPEQWAIRLADGKVFAAAGKPKESPVVTRVDLPSESGRGQMRFKIQLPPGRERLTLVYSDSDDGRQQERLIATSQLKFGAGYTLGARLPIDAKDAVCERVGSRLEPRQTRTFDPTQPIEHL